MEHILRLFALWGGGKLDKVYVYVQCMYFLPEEIIDNPVLILIHVCSHCHCASFFKWSTVQ